MMANRTTGVPPGLKAILIATIGVFVLQVLTQGTGILIAYGALVPRLVFAHGQIWRLLTYLFLHGMGPWHILFNMLALWMFGVELEQMWGTRRFVTFYFIGGIGAGLLSFFTWNVPIIGASGAVLAILTVYAYYFPNRQVLMFFIFPVPVRIAVIIIGAISIIGSMQSLGGIAHLTHLGGIVVALIYLKSYEPVMRWWEEHNEKKYEREMRNRAESRASKERHFEEVIDPILKKISEKGMDSLTREEKKKLSEASKSHKEQFKKRRIFPFDSK
ncbi:MAG: rhomboid family intramembrane serine protease [Fibrobacterota bacterium]